MQGVKMQKLSVPKSLSDKVLQFTKNNSIPLDVVTENADITVKICTGDCLESDLATMYSGGWIKCKNARLMAKNLDITKSQMGKLLDELNIKVRECGLGCF